VVIRNHNRGGALNITHPNRLSCESGYVSRESGCILIILRFHSHLFKLEQTAEGGEGERKKTKESD